MDMFWIGGLNSDGLKIYDLEVYKYALSIIPLCAIIGAVIVCLVGIKVRQKYNPAEFEGYLAS